VSALSDEDLVIAIRDGDTDSLGVLVTRWQAPLHRFVYRMLPRQEDARDICQETFLRVLKKADRFKEGSRFSTWMYQIALNLCRDKLRKQRRWGLLVAENQEWDEGWMPVASGSVEADPARNAERRQLATSVMRALDQLPASQREVLILKEFEGLKFREIAELLGCPESTVKSRMYGGLSELRAALARQGVVDGERQVASRR
jgi:RNA polymerase sigma-70 factor (ECF subfamily)